MGWKNNPPDTTIMEKSDVNKSARIKKFAPPGSKAKRLQLQQLVPYQVTTGLDSKHVKTCPSPLGALIEYVAYKAGAQPDRILKHLVDLDKDMIKKDKTSQIYVDMVTVTPQVAYDCIMEKPLGYDNFKKAITTTTSSSRSIRTNNNNDTHHF